MKFNAIFQALVPKDNKFISLFEKGAINLVKTSELLKELVLVADNVDKRNEMIKGIKEFEKCGDEITHTIFDELNKTFITPFDREDIQSLTSSIDDVVDGINSACKKIKLYNPKKFSPEFIKMADYIFEAATEINRAIADLKNIKNSSKIHEACISINTIENLADDLNHQYLSNLFEYEKDAIELIKMKEIMQNLERAVDCAENVSDVLKAIIIKNA